MDIIEKMKAEIVQARQKGERVRKEVLQTILGEIELVQSKSGVKPPDSVIHSMVRKMIASNNEVIAELVKREIILKDEGSTSFDTEEKIGKLEEENDILSDYLPPQMTVLDLVMCKEVQDKVMGDSSKNVGKLIGEIVGICKGLGYHVDGKDVKKAIDALRQPPA